MTHTKTQTRICTGGFLGLSLSALLFTSCGADSSADLHLELVDSPFRSSGLGHDHNDLTEKGLPMLSDALADTIGDENEDMDWPGSERQKTSENHLDECKFSSSFDRLRWRYSTLLATLDPDAFNRAESIKLFGQILHASQDFISHSNWVESGQTSVLNGGGFLPPPVSPGSMLGDLVVVQKGIPGHWQVGRRSTTGILSRQISVFDGTPILKSGLITGEYPGNLGESECLPTAAIFHGDTFFQGDTAGYLAKDDPDSFMHKEAIALAIRQTTEEFCRLDRMVTLRWGERGSAEFRSRWGVNAAKLKQSCPDNQGIIASVLLSAM